MNRYSPVLSIALSACAFSSSTVVAFLPRSLTPLSFRGIRHNNDTPKQEKNSNLSKPADSLSITSQLSYYPSDEPLSERLDNVQAEGGNVKFIKKGIKYFMDEIDAAEKIVKINAESAEKGAADVIEKGESDDYLLKPFAEGMVETGKILAKEMMEVRQEFDELKASKNVEESTETIIRTVVLVEKDLEKVVENVVSSLQEAETVIQSAIATMASIEGLTDTAQRNLSEKLTNAGADVEESIMVADSIAKAAKQIAADDQQVMTDLAITGERISSAIDATKSLTQQLKGTEGGAAVDAVSNTVDQAASIVKEDLSAAESIADVVGRKVSIDADAVMAMDKRAEGSIAAIKAAKSSINERGGDESITSALTALTKDAEDVRLDEDSAKELAEVISKGAANDEAALGILERSSSEVNSLIDAVNGAVDKGDASAGVAVIEKKAKDVENSISEVEKVTKEMEKAETNPATSGVNKEEGGAEITLKDRAETIPNLAEDRAVEVGDEKVGLAEHELSGDDTMIESPPENTILTTSANDAKSLEHDTVDVDSAASTIANANHHGHESLGDAISNTVVRTTHAEVATNSISSDHLTDTVLANSNPAVEFGVLLAKSGTGVSELCESIMSPSDTMHHITTSTTEALTEVAAVMLSLFSS